MRREQYTFDPARVPRQEKDIGILSAQGFPVKPWDIHDSSAEDARTSPLVDKRKERDTSRWDVQERIPCGSQSSSVEGLEKLMLRRWGGRETGRPRSHNPRVPRVAWYRAVGLLSPLSGMCSKSALLGPDANPGIRVAPHANRSAG